MIISSNFDISASLTTKRQMIQRQNIPSKTAEIADKISISQYAIEAFSAFKEDAEVSVEKRMSEIKAKSERSSEEMDYLISHDPKLSAIYEKLSKDPDSLTASEIDYLQKTGGFLNTFDYLSDDEKSMYDDLVSQGNHSGAAAIADIALIRFQGHVAGGANGEIYDPINTKITASNVRKYFMHTIIDESGKTSEQFKSLVKYLENHTKNLL